MSTKLVFPLLVVLPDKPGDPVTPITAGYTTYTCECGESYVDNLVDALGHNYVASGNVYTCTRCGDSYTGHEHSYTETTTEPTCTEAGYTVYTCSCGDSYQVDLPALGHDYVMINQDVSGKRTYRCTRCGATYTDSGVGINPPIDPDPPVEYSLRNSNVAVTTEHHEYIYASGKLLREIVTTTDAEGNITTQTLDFTYDTSGSPYTLTHTVGTTSSIYYYVVNLQGDVIRLVSGNGATVAEYRYGPYGEVLTASGAMAEVNPLRYRGYYADVETEFYYLQSRYYDPAICRFVNADGYASTGQGFLGQNMFAYCNNSPVCMTDAHGFAAGNIVTTVHMRDNYSLSYKGTYPTIEAAVQMFATRYYGVTRDHYIEVFAFIYEAEVDGQTRYKFGFIRHGYPRSDKVRAAFDVVKEGYSYDGLVIVARVHTHPTDAFDENFLPDDRVLAVGAHANNPAFQEYLVTQYSIRKFNPADVNNSLFVAPLGYVFSQYYVPRFGGGNKHGSMTAGYIM